MLPGWGQTGQSLAARQRRPGRRAAIFLMGTDGPGRCERVRGGSPGAKNGGVQAGSALHKISVFQSSSDTAACGRNGFAFRISSSL